jgi:plastocyanin
MKPSVLCCCVLGASLLAGGCRKPTDLGPVVQVAEAQAIRAALGGAGETSADDSAAAADVGEGWGTLKGRIVFEGAPPTMPPYAANKDMATCAPGGTAPPQEFLLVDPQTQGVANVAIFLRNAPRVHEGAQPSGETAVFDQKVCVFLTHVMAVSVGQPMILKNSDDVGHNTNIGGQNAFNQTIPAGESVAYATKREEAAPVPVRCSIHPWMLAYLLPRNDQYVAVTAADGSFELPNLPAGTELEFQVWHENAAGANGALVVETPAAKELQWSKKGRFKVRLEQDEVREVEITAPASAFLAG